MHVVEVAPSETPTTRAYLWGHVVTDEADGFLCGATRGTNNISELYVIGQGLMWWRDVAANADVAANTRYCAKYSHRIATEM